MSCLGVYSLGVYSLGIYSLGIYNARAADLGSGHAHTWEPIIWQSTIIEFSEVPKHDNGRLIGDTRCWKLNLPFAFMTVLYITFPEYIKHDNLDLAR